ncbi:MAG: zinc-binding dehydrogenase, partial [Actinobacteria bacterium]|nr:zinc-binding dehydrogenase [Actinomycetota bacterium]
DKHVCATAQIIGISLDGCFAETVKLPAKALWPTDLSRIRPEVAVLQEPFGNAVHACTKVNLRGQRVAIIGLGTIGLFAVAVARALGARQIIGVEPVEANRRMALTLGADAVILPSQSTPQSYIHDAAITEEIRDLTEGVGVDVSIEMSGATAALNTAIAAARRGGNVILFGIRSGDAVIEHIDRVIVDGISLHSVVGRRIWETWHITRNLLESHAPDIQGSIFDTILNGGRDCVFPASAFDQERFARLIDTHPKVILDWR